MSLTSLVFALFCIVTICIYFLVPKKIQWIILLISSLVFLFFDGSLPLNIIKFLLILVPTYFCGLLIEKNKENKKAKIYLTIGIMLIVGQLFYFKYANFFINTINLFLERFNSEYLINNLESNSLIGISYFSLIMISYLVDIYNGICKPQKNPFKCALFMTYFPILTSGPFIRYNDVEKDLYGKHKFDFNRVCNGLVRILWGLFKVLVISQRCGMFVDTVYGNLNNYFGTFILVAAGLFTIQLYTNFSGSIDIIMGISEILGIKLPENFKAPFFSTTITEFWRNWHITLGAWLRDYIFYPILKSDSMQQFANDLKKRFSKKTVKKITLYTSMLVMWTAIGIWHGGNYTFIIGSGLLQFLFMVLEDLLEPLSDKINKKLGINKETFSYRLYQRIRTFILFSFAMIFFRANTVGEALQIIKNIFVWNPWVLLDNKTLFTAGLDMYDFRILIISIVVLFVVDKLSRTGSVREKLSKQNIVFRWTVTYLLIFGIIIFGCYGVGYDPAEFIYRQF